FGLTRTGCEQTCSRRHRSCVWTTSVSRTSTRCCARGFDRLADDAKSAGVRIAFENTPFTHHVNTTQDAVAFVTEVGNPNGGLLLDIWHACRGDTPYATLPALVPPEIVFGVELEDRLAKLVGADLEDTLDNRLPCGQGAFRCAGVHQCGTGDRLGWPVGYRAHVRRLSPP